MAQFETPRASNGQVYWVFQATNNEVVEISETYAAKASAQNAIRVLQAQGAGVLDRS